MFPSVVSVGCKQCSNVHFFASLAPLEARAIGDSRLQGGRRRHTSASQLLTGGVKHTPPHTHAHHPEHTAQDLGTRHSTAYTLPPLRAPCHPADGEDGAAPQDGDAAAGAAAAAGGAASGGAEGGAGGPSGGGDAALKAVLAEVEAEEVSCEGEEQLVLRLGQLDQLLTWLWRVHGIDYYSGKELLLEVDYISRGSTFRTIRGPRPEEGEEQDEEEGAWVAVGAWLFAAGVEGYADYHQGVCGTQGTSCWGLWGRGEETGMGLPSLGQQAGMDGCSCMPWLALTVRLSLVVHVCARCCCCGDTSRCCVSLPGVSPAGYGFWLGVYVCTLALPHCSMLAWFRWPVDACCAACPTP